MNPGGCRQGDRGIGVYGRFGNVIGASREEMNELCNLRSVMSPVHRSVAEYEPSLGQFSRE